MLTCLFHTAKCRRIYAKAILAISFLLLPWFFIGCQPPGTVFGSIEIPSAIRSFGGEPTFVEDNLAYYGLGAIDGSGDIINITGLDGMMWSYPLGEQDFMEDLSGAAFTITLDVQYSHRGLGFANRSDETLWHMTLLEFRFPPPEGEGPSEISWFVTPHLVCDYKINSNETDDEAFVSISYFIYEDQLGLWDLLKSPKDGLIAAINDSGEVGEKFRFEGDSSGTLTSFNNEMSGTISATPNIKSKLFVGINVLMSAYQLGDEIQVGGRRLPNSVSDTNRCTFSVGKESYYTVKPVTEQ